MTSIQQIKDLIDSAEASLKNAKKLLLEVSGSEFADSGSAAVAATRPPAQGDASKVIEGIFNGERMTAPDGESYPVPANYASKSKLVSGDHLKLSIMTDGRFVYKQIGPVPRQTVIGQLVYEDGQYKVLANEKAYKVLLASVTYYKAQVGDKITLIIPEADDTEWGAIEAVLPKDVSELHVTEAHPEEEAEIDF